MDERCGPPWKGSVFFLARMDVPVIDLLLGSFTDINHVDIKLEVDTGEGMVMSILPRNLKIPFGSWKTLLSVEKPTRTMSSLTITLVYETASTDLPKSTDSKSQLISTTYVIQAVS